MNLLFENKTKILNVSNSDASSGGIQENDFFVSDSGSATKSYTGSDSDSDLDSDTSSQRRIISTGGKSKCKDEISTIAKDLSYLFKNNKFIEILTIIPTLHKYTFLPSSIRIIMALTLFALGRIGGALREVSLAIETESDPNEKERYIKCLVGFFKQLGMHDQAYSCFEEIIASARVEQLTNINGDENTKRIQDKIKNYEHELQDCLKNSSLKT